MSKAASLFALGLVLVASEAHATPHDGSHELRIGQEYLPPVAITNGFIRLEPEHGSGLTGMGLGAGMGWFVSDHVELGLSLSLDVIKSGEGDTTTGPGAAPFLRLMYLQGKVAYFWEVDASLQHFSSDNGTTVFSLGGDLGLEIFVTDDWAVRIAPTFRHVIISSSNGFGDTQNESGNRFGLTWGLACYF